MSGCGIWRTPRRLLAVVVDDDGRARAPISVALTADARWGLLVWLQAKGIGEVVVTDELARSDPLTGIATTLGVRLRVIPAALVNGIRRATGLANRPPKFSAAMLARWPAVAALRPYLRSVHDDCQLALW